MFLLVSAELHLEYDGKSNLGMHLCLRIKSNLSKPEVAFDFHQFCNGDFMCSGETYKNNKFE